MADPVVTRIRHAIAELCEGLATTGPRVYRSRVKPLGRLYQPSLMVYTDDEETETLTAGTPRTQQHDVALRVEGVAGAKEDELDDILDRMRAEVVAALVPAARDATTTLGGLVKDFALSETVKERNIEGERPEGGIVITFQVRYGTLEDDLTTVA